MCVMQWISSRAAPTSLTNFGKTIHEQGPLFDFEAAKGQMGKVLEKEISIHLDNVPLETVILNLSQSSGVNIVADKSLPALTNHVTANLGSRQAR